MNNRKEIDKKKMKKRENSRWKREGSKGNEKE